MNNDESESLSPVECIEGDEFYQSAFEAVRSLGTVVGATYGPHGRDKLMIDPKGTPFVSNQAADVLHRLDVRDPVGQMLVDAFGDDEHLPDGSNFAVLLASALVDEAETLVDQGVPPVSVASGYRRAVEAAVDGLDEVAVPLDMTRRERYALVNTATNGRFVDSQIEHLQQVALDACEVLAPDVSLDAVHFEHSIRLGIDSSRVVDGAILRSDPARETMPHDLEGADVLLLSDPMSTSDPTELSGIDRFDVSDPDTVEAMVESREGHFDDALAALLDTGADVVVSQGHLDGQTVRALTDEGVLAFHEVKDEDFERVQAAVGGGRTPPDGIESATLGHAGRVTVTDVGSGSIKGALFAQCPDTDIASIVVYAGTPTGGHLTEGILRQGIGALDAAYTDPRAVPGGGAAELVAARAAGDAAAETGGKDRLAVEAFADALEAPVAQLIRNSGYDPLDLLPQLKQRHASGDSDAAVDVDSGGVASAYETGVIEPVRLKRRCLYGATDFVASLLCTDAILPRTDEDTLDIESPTPSSEGRWGALN